MRDELVDGLFISQAYVFSLQSFIIPKDRCRNFRDQLGGLSESNSLDPFDTGKPMFHSPCFPRSADHSGRFRLKMIGDNEKIRVGIINGDFFR